MAGRFVLPFEAMRLTSRQGPRPTVGGRVVSADTPGAEWKQHNGTDWTHPDAPTEGTILRAGADAVVEFADNRGGVQPFGGYGNAIVLRYGPRVLSLFAHCQAIDVAAGARVVAGAPVARAGRTSRPGVLLSTSHLHWELVTRWPLAPEDTADRYDVLSSLAAAGYGIDGRGRLVYSGPSSGAAARPEAGQPGGPHLDAILPVYALAGWFVADRFGWTPAETALAVAAWEVVENGPLRASLPWTRPDTTRDSALEVGAAYLGARLARDRRA